MRAIEPLGEVARKQEKTADEATAIWHAGYPGKGNREMFAAQFGNLTMPHRGRDFSRLKDHAMIATLTGFLHSRSFTRDIDKEKRDGGKPRVMKAR